METKKILIVDDEPDILEFLKYNLDKQGYKTFTALNGVEGLKVALETIPDLIILDIMMPEMDGIETCKIIKENLLFKNTLVALLSARGEDYTQIAGFESGADDFIVKPIKIRVLIEKIKALLKRTVVVEVKNKIFINELIIDKNKFSVTKDNVSIDLPKKEFELLYLLASNPHKVYQRAEIFNIIWGNDTIVGDRTIDVHIRKLREKLGENIIKTIKGVGYRFDI
ncbi:MAG: DNA-binding response regulator [Bacteroidetes bacterium GWA2_30_7]|nr:MAG: DNA-binding response regulator [Bacteroidetes bacterium GWA2_30_7]